MFDFNDSVDRWLTDAVAAEPGLAPYADEIADHLISAAEANIASGLEPADAFAAAVRALGEPAIIAGEFRKDGGAMSAVRRLIGAETPPSRGELVYWWPTRRSTCSASSV